MSFSPEGLKPKSEVGEILDSDMEFFDNKEQAIASLLEVVGGIDGVENTLKRMSLEEISDLVSRCKKVEKRGTREFGKGIFLSAIGQAFIPSVEVVTDIMEKYDFSDETQRTVGMMIIIAGVVVPAKGIYHLFRGKFSLTAKNTLKQVIKNRRK